MKNDQAIINLFRKEYVGKRIVDGKIGFHPSQNPREIEQFILKALHDQRAEIVEEIEKELIVHRKDLPCKDDLNAYTRYLRRRLRYHAHAGQTEEGKE